jgi:HK97 family phage prohead protease
MTLETIAFTIDELKADDESRTVEGLASVFNNVDSYKDIVLPGAFAKSLKTRMPAMLWQHRSDMPIGVWDEAEETPKGLRVKGRILDTAAGEDAYKLVKARALTGMSIGYSARNYEIDDKKGLRKLIEVDLFEVSLVTFPANEKAQITRVNSRPDTLRQFEEFLREAGFSQKDATTVALRGFNALSTQGEPDEEEAKAALSAITNATNILKGINP